MADDGAAMEEKQEDEEEAEGAAEEEDEGENEESKYVTPAPSAAPVLENNQQQQQEDAVRGEHSSPMSSNPPAPSAPGPPTVFKELQQVEVELRLLEALQIYHPSKLLGMHRHFVLFGLMENLERRLNHHFKPEEILELLDRFYNLELLKPDEEEMELLSQEEEFSLPESILAVKEEPNGSS